MKRRFLKLFTFLLLATALFIVFKNPILRGIGSFLIYENEFEKVENAFVLSGQAYDRGNFAAMLYENNKVSKIYCTGANKPPDLEVFGTDLLESDLTKIQILKSLDSLANIQILPFGTSTLEESEGILNFCRKNNIEECVIISSKFHTKRVKDVFKKKFNKNGIKIYIQGAPSSVYNENEWWKNEYGLLAVNNEYIKLLYYLVK